MVIIEVVFEAATDARHELIKLMRRTTKMSRREKGCVLYRFTADLEFPNRFILTELWETEKDLKAHFMGEAFKNFFIELQGKGDSVSHVAWQGPLVSYIPPNPTG
jgi:quinol monooxygenase YgiN